MCCPACTNIASVHVPLPVEPLFDRASTCMLVPVKNTTLARWISRHPGVLSGPWYTGRLTRRRRLFTADDIRLLRTAFVHNTIYGPSGRSRVHR
jgi:hypothetical protein